MNYICPWHRKKMTLQRSPGGLLYYACPNPYCSEVKAAKQFARQRKNNDDWTRRTAMPLSGQRLLDERGGTGAPLLHGSDLPKNQTKVVVKVTGVREAPDGFNSPAILDIEEVDTPNGTKSAWALNKTNLRALIERYGDDLEKIVGKRIPLHVAMVNNPKTRKMTRSLFVNPPE